MTASNGYEFLESRPDSHYRQLFFKGRKIRAEVFYSATVGEEARSPEEVAADFDVPVEAVREAVDYCLKHADVIARDHAMENESIRRRGLDKAPLVPPWFKPGDAATGGR